MYIVFSRCSSVIITKMFPTQWSSRIVCCHVLQAGAPSEDSFPLPGPFQTLTGLHSSSTCLIVIRIHAHNRRVCAKHVPMRNSTNILCGRTCILRQLTNQSAHTCNYIPVGYTGRRKSHTFCACSPTLFAFAYIHWLYGERAIRTVYNSSVMWFLRNVCCQHMLSNITRSSVFGRDRAGFLCISPGNNKPSTIWIPWTAFCMTDSLHFIAILWNMTCRYADVQRYM